jgi:hypothetical protein
MILHRTLTICTIFCAGVTMAGACDPGCDVSVLVKVVDEENAPILGATVTEIADCCPADDCVRSTNEKGEALFEFATMGGDDCLVRVEKENYLRAEKSYQFPCPHDQHVSTDVEVVLRRP